MNDIFNDNEERQQQQLEKDEHNKGLIQFNNYKIPKNI